MSLNSTIRRALIASALTVVAMSLAGCDNGGSDDNDADTSIERDTETSDVDDDAELEDSEDSGDSDDATDSAPDTPDLSDGDGTTNACSPSTGVVLADSYIVGVETALNGSAPFIFRLNVEESAGRYELELQALVKDDCPQGVGCVGSTPRTDAGDPVVLFPVAPDASGTLSVSFAGLQMPSSANSGTGTALDADINIEVSICSQDRLCGTAEIVVNSLGGAELSGTVEALATDDFGLQAVPEVSGNCMRYVPSCGDDICNDSESATSCPADCEPVPATCYTQDSLLPTGVGEKVDGLSQDGDDLCDRDEAQLMYNGTDCSTVADCDGDGINDDAEILFLTDEVGGTGFATDVVNPNTDEAGENDGDEIASGGDPTTNVDNIGPDDVTPRLDGTAYGYVSQVEIAGPDCCFTDLDDDAGIDNDVVTLIASLSSTLSGFFPNDFDASPQGINNLIQAQIDAGLLNMIVRFDNLPADLDEGARSDVSITIFRSEVDEDDTVEDRRSGLGSYTTVDALGQSFSAMIRGSELLVRGGMFEFAPGESYIPMVPLALFSGLLIVPLFEGLQGVQSVRNLDIRNLRVRGALHRSAGGSSSQIGVESDGQIAVGGAIPYREIVEFENELFSNCYPSLQEDILTIDTTSNPGRIEIACTETLPAFVNDEGLDGICADVAELLPTFCRLLDSVYGSNFSVDTDGDGKRDALTFGARVELSGAANTADGTGD